MFTLCLLENHINLPLILFCLQDLRLFFFYRFHKNCLLWFFKMQGELCDCDCNYQQCFTIKPCHFTLLDVEYNKHIQFYFMLTSSDKLLFIWHFLLDRSCHKTLVSLKWRADACFWLVSPQFSFKSPHSNPYAKIYLPQGHAVALRVLQGAYPTNCT